MKLLYLGDPARYSRYAADVPALAAHDCTALSDTLSDDEVIAAGANAEVLFVEPNRSIVPALMDALPRLRMIVAEGVAFHRFSPEEAKARHIYICNCKGSNADPVAEQAILLMLGLLRQVLPSHSAVMEGRQDEVKLAHMRCGDLKELCECRVGLVGFGDIARSTARLLKPFGAEVVYWNRTRRSPEEEAKYGVSYLPLEKLAATSDIVSLHLAVAPETTGIVDAAFLARMKPGALLINTARGDLVDNAALCAALQSGHLGGAGLDVIAPEPVPADHPLLHLPVDTPVLFSPHLGGNTAGSFRRAYEMVAQMLDALERGETPPYWVNPW